MTNQSLLDASCRLALAALTHDMGKFAERARIDEANQKDREGNRQSDLNKQLYCPQYQGRHTHVHAAYTAIALDIIEQHMPELVGAEMSPFKSWRDKDADDSLINAAAMHHKPITFLQWVIATADRLASGFEREEFARYNQTEDNSEKKLNHYTTRQLTLLEQVTLKQDDRPRKNHHNDFSYCYPLKPLSPDSIFPVARANAESLSRKDAQAEYQALWDSFRESLEAIPKTHRQSLSLWLDHFDSLWGCYTHTIPSATVGRTAPDVSLYDHSRTTAALATALWRYHHDHQHDEASAKQQLRAQWDKERQEHSLSESAWQDNKFLLIQGDFFGIQNFIFSSGSETQKRAAKLLRGRSFYISLLSECAALKVLDALSLPPTSQVINAAGKFLIVAPNTPEVIESLKQAQAELDQWFLSHSYGQSGVGLAWLPASCNDFKKAKDGEVAPFQQLIGQLFKVLDLKKHRRLSLASSAPEHSVCVFEDFLNSFNTDQGVCAIDGKSPGVVPLKDTERFISALAQDQIAIGNHLTKFSRLLITRDTTAGSQSLRESAQLQALGLPVFGYRIAFTEHEEQTGRFKPLVDQGHLLRAIDFSLPKSAQDPLWNGYARRQINAYVPKVSDDDVTEESRGKYAQADEPFSLGDLKTLNHLACADKALNEHGRWKGQTALMTLKGDVDNLGLIFQQGLGAPSFAKMAALSRQMNAFFALYLPWLCQSAYPNAYTVFAGGDDFFLIGPWQSTMKLAARMQRDFKAYVAHNPEVHFSSGLSMTKPGLPIRYLADTGEEALEQAKSYQHPTTHAEKNAVSCFSQVMHWNDFDSLLAKADRLGEKREELQLSTGYLYGLLNLIDKREKLAQGDYTQAIWRSYFSYRTYRMLERKKLGTQYRRAAHEILSHEIAEEGIEQHQGNYRVTLFSHLYQQRD